MCVCGFEEMGMKRDVGGSSLGEEVALLGPSQSKGTGGLISAPAPNSASMKASPSYEVLNKAGLLTLTYLKNNISDLDLKKPNTTKGYNMRLKTAWACCLPPMLGCVVYSCLHKEYHVLPRHVLKLIDDKGDHRFAGPGLHNIGELLVPFLPYSFHSTFEDLVVAGGLNQHSSFTSMNGEIYTNNAVCDFISAHGVVFDI